MTDREFAEYARNAFRFLTERYGFEEERISKKDLKDQPFRVRFRNRTTWLTVEGVHWGFGVYVGLGSCDPALMREKAYNLDDLLAIRDANFQAIRPNPQDTADIQRVQIDQYAQAVRVHATDILTGDFTIFPWLAAAIAARRKQYDDQERSAATSSKSALRGRSVRKSPPPRRGRGR
jgi:hypothetical protein